MRERTERPPSKGNPHEPRRHHPRPRSPGGRSGRDGPVALAGGTATGALLGAVSAFRAVGAHDGPRTRAGFRGREGAVGPLAGQWRVMCPIDPVRWTGGELVALRWWRLVRWGQDAEVRLQSLSSHHIWHGPVFAADHVPLADRGCASGVYALKPCGRPNQRDWLWRDAWVWGWVSLIGRVVEHQLGYRAERVVIRRLHLGVRAHLACSGPEDVRNLAAELEARYQCAVRRGYWETRKARRLRWPPDRPVESPPVGWEPVAPPPPMFPTPPRRSNVNVQASVPVPAPSITVRVPGRPRRRRPPGTSPDGLRYADVRRAFRKAERRLGRTWKLKGNGHCPRATLNPHYSRALGPATRCWSTVRFGITPVRVFPLAIVLEAARLLGVNPRKLICTMR